MIGLSRSYERPLIWRNIPVAGDWYIENIELVGTPGELTATFSFFVRNDTGADLTVSDVTGDVEYIEVIDAPPVVIAQGDSAGFTVNAVGDVRSTYFTVTTLEAGFKEDQTPAGE
jgi:hypothetical protein